MKTKRKQNENSTHWETMSYKGFLKISDFFMWKTCKKVRGKKEHKKEALSQVPPLLPN